MRRRERLWGWVWKRGWRRRIAVAGVVVLVAGVVIGYWNIRAGSRVVTAGLVIIGVAFAWFLLASVKKTLPDSTRAGGAAVYITALGFGVALPLLLVGLETGSSSAIFAVFKDLRENSDPASLGSLCVFAIPVLVFACPEMLHRWLLWNGASSRDRELLSAWLAAGAVVATWSYIFLLRFGGQALAPGKGKNHPPSILAVAAGAVFVALLLAPFYRFVVRSCWKYGIAVALDPGRQGAWRQAWREGYGDVSRSFRSGFAADVAAADARELEKTRKDVTDLVSQVDREISEDGTLRLSRSFEAPIKDVWGACTDPGRISRWLFPITGDLHLGGTYQLGNGAGGTVLRCEPPSLLVVTLGFEDGPLPEVEVRLSPQAKRNTVLEIKQTATVDPATWAQLEAGTAGDDCDLVLATGVDSDQALRGLSRHLSGVKHARSWQRLNEYEEFVIQSTNAWGAAFQAAGATPAQAAVAIQNVKEHFNAVEPSQGTSH